MKLLVFSDSHGWLENARNVLRRIGGRMDMVCHLGDYDSDAEELQKEFPTLPFHVLYHCAAEKNGAGRRKGNTADTWA